MKNKNIYSFFILFFGIAFVYSLFSFTRRIEKQEYLSEIAVESNSFALNLDLIVANYSLKIQNFCDYYNIKDIYSDTNKEVVLTAFEHTVFSTFSLLKYDGVVKKANSELIDIDRLLRVTAPNKPNTPLINPSDSKVHSTLVQKSIRDMVRNNEMQKQFFVEVKGEIVYIIITRSLDDKKIFFAFSGFAKNLLLDTLPTMSDIEVIIHQYANSANWLIIKSGKNVTIRAINDTDYEKASRSKIVSTYDSRFGTGKHFKVSVLSPQEPPRLPTISSIVLYLGLVITFLIVFLLHYLVTRNIRIDRLVKVRTRELEEESKKATRAAAAKSRFLANVSHEIRTPLNIVLGMVDLIQETPLSHLQQEYVRSINTSGRHLLNLINDVLDMTRIDVSEVIFNMQMSPILPLIEESCLAIDELAKNKNIDFYLEVDPLLPNEVEVDPSRIRQILVNLLTNAVKYTQFGQIRLKVNLEKRDSHPNLIIEIVDTGIGISEIDQQEIFKAFYQVNSIHRQSQGGVGLGLSIVASIVKRLSGNISVVSKLGQGSTFVVSIPIKNFSDDTWSELLRLPTKNNLKSVFVSGNTHFISVVRMYNQALNLNLIIYESFDGIFLEDVEFNCLFIDLSSWDESIKNTFDFTKFKKIIFMNKSSAFYNRAHISNNYLSISNKLLFPSKLIDILKAESLAKDLMPLESPKEIDATKGHVLIVEDDPANKILFEAFCASQDWSVSFAENGQDALTNYLSKRHFDVMVTDIQMPIMDGFTLIRNLDEQNRPDYVIVLSADSTIETLELAKGMDIDEFLSKPVRKTDFIGSIVRGLLYRKSSVEGRPSSSC